MDIDRPRVLAAASFVAAVASLQFNVLPLINQAWAISAGLDEAEVGLLNAYALGGFGLGVASAPIWIRRISWRVSIGVGSIATATLSFVMPFVPSPLESWSLFAGLGVSTALLLAPTVTMIGDATHAERAFGIMYASQILLAMALSVVLTGHVIPLWGLAGALYLIGSLTLSPLVLLRLLPEGGTTVAARAERIGAGLWVSLTLGGIVVFIVGVVGTWSFLEHLASHKGILEGSVSLVVTAALAAGFLGSVAASIIDDGWGRMLPFGATAVLMASGILLLDWSRSVAPFYLGALATSFGWNFGLTFATGLLADVDVTGRFVSLSPGAIGLGAAAGTVLLGEVIVNEGYTTFLRLSAVIVILGLSLLAATALLSARSQQLD